MVKNCKSRMSKDEAYSLIEEYFSSGEQPSVFIVAWVLVTSSFMLGVSAIYETIYRYPRSWVFI